MSTSPTNDLKTIPLLLGGNAGGKREQVYKRTLANLKSQFLGKIQYQWYIRSPLKLSTTFPMLRSLANV